jgi:hypothetical protein
MLDNNNPLSLALTKAFLADIYNILATPFHDIKWLDYVDDQGNEILLPSGYQYMLRIIKHYDSYHTSGGDPIGDEWKTVTADHQYDGYCLSEDYAGVASLSSSPQVTSGIVALGASTAPRARDVVFEFKKGIKRDSVSYFSTRTKNSGTLGNVQHSLKLELKIFMRFLTRPIFPFPVKTSNYSL